jgi:FAD/FMN-containing dehydrogenase
VLALEVALADGTLMRDAGCAASLDGPDLARLFVGAEGHSV